MINSLSNEYSTRKRFTDNKINVNKKSRSVSGRKENIVRTEENVGYMHFLPFPQYFSNAFRSVR